MSAYSTTNKENGVEQMFYTLPEGLPVAQLQTVNFARLQDGDKEEAEKLFSAAKNEGFFYLDIQGTKTDVSKVIDGMFDLDKELYDLDFDAKMQYDTDKISKMKLNGYKPVGRNFGGIGGKKDGFETYAIPKDGILNIGDAGSFPRPGVIDAHMANLQAFALAIQTAQTAILRSLSKSLSLPAGEGFEDYHRGTVASPDIVRLLKYHAQPIEERGAAHTPHTDLGSLTFLFTRQPGLQVLAPNAKDWGWVLPKRGHAIVNFGDGMATLTNGFFHSCLHRVGPLPGHAMATRYSFAYLSRAEEHTPMTGLRSALIPAADPEAEVYTSGEWIKRKFGMLRLESHKKSEDAWVLTGRPGALPA